MALTPLEECASMAAKLRCLILDHAEYPPDVKRRLLMAASILESGSTPNPFELVGAMSLKEVKRRYIEYVVAREGGLFAAAKALGLHESTLWRIGKVDERNGITSILNMRPTEPPPPDKRIATGGAKGPRNFSGAHSKSLSRKP